MKPFLCPHCKSRNIRVGSMYNFSTYLPEHQRGAIARERRECICRLCHHKWESNHPIAMGSAEPTNPTDRYTEH